MVCRLNKSLYGLKQAPRAWYPRFATFLLTLGFTEVKVDTSMFIYRRGDETAYLLLYVDDIVLKASSHVTPSFKVKTKCIAICMPGSSFIHIETS